MKKWARVSALLPWVAGLVAAYLAYRAALSLDRTEMESIFICVIAAVAATLSVETWQGNRQATARRRQERSTPEDPKAPRQKRGKRG